MKLKLSKRLVSLLSSGAVLLGGIVFYLLLGRASHHQGKPAVVVAPAPIRLLEVRNAPVVVPVELDGQIEAISKIELYAEVSGLFRYAAHPFREGVRFSKGEVLLFLDDAVYRNNVLAEKSQLLNKLTLVLPDLIVDFPEEAAKWKRYTNAFSFEKGVALLPKTNSDRERNYLAAREIYDQFYKVRSMEETLAKYRIIAPFDGIVTESEVNPGALVRTGQKLGEFTATGRYELEAPVSVHDALLLKEGGAVTLSSKDLDDTLTGTIKRINRVISPKTQTVSVYVEIEHPALGDGMFLDGYYDVTLDDAQEIPRKLLQENESLFVMRDSLLVLVPVRLLAFSGENAVVRGLENGEKVLLDPTPGMYDGMNISELSHP